MAVENQAPFNMALATLMRCDEILKHYTVVQTGKDYRSGEPLGSATARVLLKHQLLLAFIISTMPLLKKDSRERVKQLKKELPIFVEEKWTTINGVQKQVSIPIKDADDILDDSLIEIEELLQKESYFMPPKDDPRHSFAREK